MVELRKRKAATDAVTPAVKKANSVKSISSSKKGGSSADVTASANGVSTFRLFGPHDLPDWPQMYIGSCWRNR